MDIKLSGVSKVFKNGFKLEDINLGIRSGEVMGLIGPMGSGKTTCLKLISNQIHPTSGFVLIGGREIPFRTIYDHRTDLIYIPETIQLDSSLTFFQNLMFLDKLYCKNLSKRERRNKLNELFQGFERQALKKRFPNQLMQGAVKEIVYQYFSSFCNRVFIVDEPFFNCSNESAITFLKKLKRNGNTVVFASSIFSEGYKECSRMGFIKSGKLVALGDFNALSVQYIGQESVMDVFFLERLCSIILR